MNTQQQTISETVSLKDEHFAHLKTLIKNLLGVQIAKDRGREHHLYFTTLKTSSGTLNQTLNLVITLENVSLSLIKHMTQLIIYQSTN